MGEVRLVGVRSVDEDELIDGLGLTHAREIGQPFARFLVQLDRRRIRGYYVRRGFFAIDVQAEVKRGDVRTDVTFTIIEGARARLARVEFVGLPDDPRVSPADLRAHIPIDDGEAFAHEPWELSKPVLMNAMQELGYAWAKVDGVVIADEKRAEAVIRVMVEAGPLAEFGDVSVNGVPAGLEAAVNARIDMKRGERFSPRALERTRAALYELGRFSLVRVEPDRTVRGAVVKVAITVAEAPRNELRLGFGFGLDPLAAEVRTRTVYGVTSWPTPLTSSRFEVRPALGYVFDRDDFAPRFDALASLDRIDLLRPRYGGSAEIGYQFLAAEAYTSYGPRLRLGLRTPTYADAVRVTAAWQLALVDYTDLSPVIDMATEERLGLDTQTRVGAFEQNVVVDLRDDPVAPRDGAYFEVRAEEGTPAAGGAKSYLRLLPEARGYLGLGPFVLGLRARLGTLIGEDVPPTRRFFSGGANSQRGFPERHLSPFARGVVDGASRSVPYGGTALFEASGELRFPMPNVCLPWIECLIGRFAGAAFVDAGDVTETWDELDVTRLHTAAGFGLRFPTPVGALRFDVGRRLNRVDGEREPRTGDLYSFHLSVGEAF